MRQFLITAIAYWAGAELGVALTVPGTNFGLVWPPVGIALALALLWGPRTFLGIAIGAFASNLPFWIGKHGLGPSVTLAALQTGVDVIEVAAGSFLVHRFCGTRPFDKIAGVMKFAGAALLSQGLGATVSSLLVDSSDPARVTSLGTAWWTYWVSNVIGILVITPMILGWSGEWRRPTTRSLATQSATYATVALGTLLVFRFHVDAPTGTSYFEYFAILFVLWAAFALDRRGATDVTLIVACVAMWSTAKGYGPFATSSSTESLLLLGTFLSTAALTGLILGAELTERRRSEQQVLALNAQLLTSYDSTLEGWSLALDLRDRETEGHSRRVVLMTVRLARWLGVPESDIVHMRRGAILHDIGKMGVPDQILLKPAALTAEEQRLMRQHPVFSREMLSHIPFLERALDIPCYHHEKWDGTGYPEGLKATEIPLAARIFAVVDVWDALRSDRPYRKGWSEELAEAHIRSEIGAHFEPAIALAFLESQCWKTEE